MRSLGSQRHCLEDDIKRTHLKEAGCKNLKWNELLEVIKSFSKLYDVF